MPRVSLKGPPDALALRRTREWSLDAALAGLPLALIAAGPVIVASVGDRTLPVYACQIAVAVLVVHIGFSALAHRGYEVPPVVRWLLAAAALLAVPLVWSTDAGVLAYVNFASGTVGGLAIALIWQSHRGRSWVDVGYVVFLVAGTAQLTGSLMQARSVSALHQSSETPWGNSNFVAGCLVVAALIVMARGRKWLVVAGLAAIGVALLTLSRGAVVAACVGAVFFLWSKSKPRQVRTKSGQVNVNAVAAQLLSRGLAICVPIAAFMAIDHVTGLRAQVNNKVFTNIDDRLEMWRLAWRQFREHPFTGGGWASFRETSLDAAGESQTFAHNVVLSMLQMGGLLAVPYLIVLSVLVWRAFRYGGPYRAAVAAAIAISMTDPFFESTAGNLIVLPVVFLAGIALEDWYPRRRRRTDAYSGSDYGWRRGLRSRVDARVEADQQGVLRQDVWA